MSYRVKQFVWAVTAKLTQDDKRFISQYLDGDERELFYQLKVYEQRHSVMVARALAAEKNTSEELIKLGLLHDIGKIVYPIGPIRKSIMVILDKLMGEQLKKLNQLKMVKCYYHHPILGYEVLSKTGKYNKVFLKKVKAHHEKLETLIEEDMTLLKKYDDQH